MHYENYGFETCLHFEAEYAISIPNVYSWDVYLKLDFYYISPLDITLAYTRSLETGAIPQFTITVGSVLHLLHLETEITETAEILVKSWTMAAMGHEPWAIQASDWTTSGYDYMDPYWTFDGLSYLISNGYAPSSIGNFYPTYTYLTETF